MGRVFVDPEQEDGLLIFVGTDDEEWSPERCIRLWRNGKITKDKGTLTHREAQRIKPTFPEDSADLQQFLKTGSWD